MPLKVLLKSVDWCGTIMIEHTTESSKLYLYLATSQL